MSSSDKIPLRRCGRSYLIAAAACGVFGFAYEQFSHGAYSKCMLFFFLIPLLGGALPVGLRHGDAERWVLSFRGI